jgi:hypothetical protein
MDEDIVDPLLGTAKRYVEEQVLIDGKQLFEALYNTPDVSLDSKFRLDKLLARPYAVAYREKNGESVIRPFEAGSGEEHDLPISSEKTPISQELLDKAVVGIDVAGGFGVTEIKRVSDITKQHWAGHNMTKNKQALDVLLDGVFQARGVGGVDLNKDVDYLRDNSLNNIAYDFTAVGAKFFEYIAQVQQALSAKGASTDITMIAGANTLAFMGQDEEVQNAMLANAANVLVQQSINPPTWQGTKGLTQVFYGRGGAMLTPITVLAYAPGTEYRASKGSADEPWIPVDDSVFFPTNEESFNVQRGMTVFDDQQKPVRVAANLAIDKYYTDDPITTFIRSNTRHLFAWANIDHTASSTGTFA